MADAVTTQILADGPKYVIYKFTNISDGTGEAAVAKTTIANLAKLGQKVCNGLEITKVWAVTDGMGVDILWEATANVLAMSIPQSQFCELDLMEEGAGIPNNAGSGVTGNILFTTFGHTLGDRYTIILRCRKNYAAG